MWIGRFRHEKSITFCLRVLPFCLNWVDIFVHALKMETCQFSIRFLSASARFWQWQFFSLFWGPMGPLWVATRHQQAPFSSYFSSDGWRTQIPDYIWSASVPRGLDTQPQVRSQIKSKSQKKPKQAENHNNRILANRSQQADLAQKGRETWEEGETTRHRWNTWGRGNPTAQVGKMNRKTRMTSK